MTQHLTFAARLRSALGHQDGQLVGATPPAHGSAELSIPVEGRGASFAERLRAALSVR